MKVELIIKVYLTIYYIKIVSKKLKRETLYELLNEYKKDRNNRIIKCLCFFIDDEKYLNTMKCLCGDFILFELINYDCYYSKESKVLLMKYINQISDSESDIEDRDDVIKRC